MARFARTQSISITDTVTAQTLHQLIETCTLADLSGFDIAGVNGGIFFTAATSATPNPSLAPFWYSTDPVDPVFRVFAAPWNVWLTVGPDRFEVPLKNSAATDCLRGALVVSSAHSDFTLGSNPSLNAIGFAQSFIPAGSFGPVATMGVGFALFGSGNSGHTDIMEGHALIARGTRPGCCASIDITNSAGSGPMFGMWLDKVGLENQVGRVFIWRPTLTDDF